MKILIRFSSIVIAALLGNSLSMAQTPAVTAGSETSCAGNIMIPLAVTDFTNLSAMSLSLKYDSAVLEYNGYQNFSTDLQPGLFQINNDGNRFLLTWVSVTPVTLADGVFLELLFTTSGGTSNLEWDLSTQGACELSDATGNPVTSDFINGLVNAPGQVPLIYSEPQDASVIDGNNHTFTCYASGAVSQVWQESTNDGLNWNNLSDGGMYSGTNWNTMTLFNVPLSMDGTLYRSIVTGACPLPDTSDIVTLNVGPVPPTVILTIQAQTSCAGDLIVPVEIQDFTGVSAFSLTLEYDNSKFTYTGSQGLHPSVDAGNFVINDNGGEVIMTWYSETPVTIASGNLIELLFTTIGQYTTLNWNTTAQGACEIVDVNGNEINTVYNNGTFYSTGNPPSIFSQPEDKTITESSSTTLNLGASSVNTLQWQVSTDSGSTWTDLVNDATYSNAQWYNLTISNASLDMTGYQYRCHITGPCPPDIYSTPVELTVLPYPQIIKASFPNIAICEDSLTLPLMVENFDGVGAVSMVVNFDTSLLSYSGLKEINPGLGGTLVDNDLNTSIYISWASVTPVSLGNVQLFSLSFLARKDGSGSISWNTAEAGNVEFSDGNGIPILHDLYNGYVNVHLVGGVSVSFSGLDSVYCSNNASVPLTGVPGGGIFSGPGISGPVFDPAVAGPGNHTIVYTYTNVYGCEFTASEQTLVYPAPLVDLGTDISTCTEDTIFLDAGPGFAAYNWSDGITTTQVLPVTTSDLYSISVTDTNGCSFTSPPVNISFISGPSKPVITVGGPVQFCEGDSVILSAPSGYTKYLWNSGDTTETVTVKINGNYTVQVEDSGGCGSEMSDTLSVNVYPLPLQPTLSVTADTTICEGESLILTASSGSDSYLWQGGETTQSISAGTSGTYYVQAVNGGICYSLTSDSLNITVELLPDANFSYSVSILEASFSNLSLSAFSYMWDFGDGQTSTETNPIHTFGVPGEYTVKLYATSPCGTDSSIQQIIAEGPACTLTASFTFSKDPVTQIFQFTPSEPGLVYKWYFGNGDSSVVESPLYQYPAEGTYEVCLTVTDPVTSCTDDTCIIVTTGSPGCLAQFIALADPGNNLLYSFTDQSSGLVSSWYWNFGDGSISNLQNPIHEFAGEGIFTVCLYTLDETSGCISEICQDIKVGNVDVYADFSYTVNGSNLSVSFTNNSEGSVTESYWTFGDGSISDLTQGSHTYPEPGVYTVCLTVRNESTGSFSNTCKDITVGELLCDVRSSFRYFVDPENLSASFRSNSTGSVQSLFWNFGDGSTSTLESPVHSYLQPGYYIVTLSVRDNNNFCMDQSEQLIQIGSSDCGAAFGYMVNSTDNSVQFRDDSKGNVDFWFWDFGDGNFDTEQNPENTYEIPGIYLVGQMVLDLDGGCIDYLQLPVQAGEVDCAADFIYHVDSITSTAYFTNRVLGESTALLWSFGDGSFSTRENPTHIFTEEGIYPVGLNTYDFVSGCMDYYEDLLLISGLGIDCEADFVYRVDPVTSAVKFSNESLGDIVSSQWNFGDDSELSEEANPIHTYSREGYYYVCLNVTNEEGIRNMSCKWVYTGSNVAEKCRASFIYTVDSANLTIKFVDQSIGSINKYTWDFGDSGPDSVSFLKNPEHTYNQKGYYLVQLKVENSAGGCSSSEYRLINTAEAQVLKASFGYEALDPDKKKAGYPVDLVSASSGDGATVEWDFGDKQLKKAGFTVMDSTSGIVTHYYERPGKYNVCVRITDPVTKQSDTYCQLVTTKQAVSVGQTLSNPATLNIYPNPVSENAVIQYSVPERQFVEITVIDGLGRVLETLAKGTSEPGDHELEFESAGKPSGIYHLRFVSGSHTITKQLVISR